MIVLTLPDIATEDRLLQRARQGDQDALSTIYEQYFGPIYQFIRLRVDDALLAEDLAAEVFLKLIAALRGRNAPRASLRGWLFRVARNALHDHYDRGFTTEALDGLEDWMPAPSSDEPEEQVVRALSADQIRRAIRILSVDQQEVLILRFGQKLSLQETAEIMGRQVGAVKSLQFRAVSALRQILEATSQGASHG